MTKLACPEASRIRREQDGGLQQRSTQNDDEQDEQGENYGGYCPEACAERQLWPTARLSIIPQLGSPAFVGSHFSSL